VIIDKIIIKAAAKAPQSRVRGIKTSTAMLRLSRLAVLLTQSGIGLAVAALPEPKAQSTCAAAVTTAKIQQKARRAGLSWRITGVG
jgi:hypothetical protein